MDPASIITSVKVAYDIAKGISSLKSEVERNEAVSKVLEVLISVQFQASAVLAHNHDLETEKYNLAKKIVEFENWAETERNHETTEVIPDIRVYIAKGLDDKVRQSANWYCTNCWTDKIQSILHLENKNDYVVSYFCPKCKNTFSHHFPTPLLPSQRTHRSDFT
jgi:rubrerythrin